tara:strand:+ start:250 stop:570 length:321 start_codon:yes stop_codon:yes gene_type:complete
MNFINYDTKNYKINGQDYELYVADTNQKRIKGLSGINSILPNKGMIFEYENCGEKEFTMENTNFPLYIIFLDEEMNVLEHHLAKARQKERIYCGNKNCKFVIEIPG